MNGQARVCWTDNLSSYISMTDLLEFRKNHHRHWGKLFNPEEIRVCPNFITTLYFRIISATGYLARSQLPRSEVYPAYLQGTGWTYFVFAGELATTWYVLLLQFVLLISLLLGIVRDAVWRGDFCRFLLWFVSESKSLNDFQAFDSCS